MTLKRISDKWLYKHMDGSGNFSFLDFKISIAQAQLEADLKDHEAVIKEIKEGIEKLIGDNYVWDEDIYKDWQEFWQKYGGKDV